MSGIELFKLSNLSFHDTDLPTNFRLDWGPRRGVLFFAPNSLFSTGSRFDVFLSQLVLLGMLLEVPSTESQDAASCDEEASGLDVFWFITPINAIMQINNCVITMIEIVHYLKITYKLK